MSGKIHHYLAGDHQRLDALLERAIVQPGEYRRRGLRPIPLGFAQAHRHGGKDSSSCGEKAARRTIAVAPKLRLDHGALAALLVPPPTAPVVAAIRAILKAHNPIEEDPGGVYDECEELAGAEADQILRQLQNFSEVKVLPHVDSPFVMEATRRALARAGYDLEI